MDPAYHHPEDFAADDSFINYCFKCNKEDEHFWKQWLRDHSDKRETIQKARKLVFLMGIKLSPYQKQQEWEKVDLDQQVAVEEEFVASPFHKKTWLIACLTILVLAGAGAAYWLTFKTPQTHKIATTSPAQYETSAGQKHAIVLKDGTQVWLNADSKLTCNTDFDHSDRREVTLSGEAYFAVSKDPEKPFIIYANNMNIKVLGTVFNVKAYPDDKMMETTLIRGAIEVSLKNDPARKIRLKPHEKMTVFNTTIHLEQIGDKPQLKISKDTLAEFSVSQVHHDPLLDSGILETAWMKGKLAFRNERFDELALQMKHKYDMQFHFTADDLKAYRFTGIFSTETIDQALHALQLTSPSKPFDYKIEGQEVFIFKDKMNE